MNIFKITLKNHSEQFVRAQRYRKEGEQYVFESDGDTEVQFFDAAEVVGITVLSETDLRPKSTGVFFW